MIESEALGGLCDASCLQYMELVSMPPEGPELERHPAEEPTPSGRAITTVCQPHIFTLQCNKTSNTAIPTHPGFASLKHAAAAATLTAKAAMNDP